MPASLPLRPLGQNTGIQIPAIGLGLASLGGFYGPAGSLDEKVAVLDHAYETGLRFWDMADIYRDSEDAVGEWVKRSGNKNKRDDVFIATKFALQPQPNGWWSFRSDPEYVKEACERSLKRLGVDTIDLYYCHRVDGVTPIERTVEAMVELKNQGKIRYLGLSGVSASTLRRAHAVHPITALQMEYSLFSLAIESPSSEILKTCRELGVTVVAYSPIGHGVLSGQFMSHTDIPEGDLRRVLPRYSETNFPKIVELLKGLKDVAAAHGCTPAQVALAWLLAQGSDIVPIPGTKKRERMEENAAAALVRLSEKEVRMIRGLAEGLELEGPRYPPAMMATLNTDTPPL